MQKKYIIILIVSIFFLGGMFSVGLVGFFTYGYVRENFVFNYLTSGNTVEEISLNADISDIEIKYNKSNMPQDVAMRIVLDIDVEGILLLGRKYEDYFFPIDTVNNSQEKVLNFKIKPKAIFDPTQWFMGYDIKLIATLRTDLTYNISCKVQNGDVLLRTQENVSMSQISINSGEGDINIHSYRTNFTEYLDLDLNLGNIDLNSTECIFNKDIDINIATGGDINMRSYNNSFLRDLNWNFKTNTGTIQYLIHQNEIMNNSVDGTGDIDYGTIRIDYYDTSPLVGGRFSGTVTTGNVYLNNLGNCVKGVNFLETEDFDESDAKYNFQFKTNTGRIIINGESE